MSPFFLNGPETAARQSAPTSRQSLLLLKTYHYLHGRAPTASSTEGELSPNPELQLPVTLPPKTTPSHPGITLNLSTPAPDRPVKTEGLIAIPKKHPGRASKAALKTRANREVKAKGERKEKEIGRVAGRLGVEKVLAVRSS